MDIEMSQPFVHVIFKKNCTLIMFRHAQQLSIEFFTLHQQILSVSK